MRDFRPLGLGGIFDAFLKVIFNKNAMSLSGLYALLIVPALFLLGREVFNAITGVFSGLFGQDSSAFSGNSLAPEIELPPLVILGLILYSLFLFFLYNLMACRLYGARFVESPHRFWPSFRAMIKKVPGHLLFTFFQAIYYIIIYIILSLIIGVVSMLTMAAGFSPLAIVIIIIFFLLMIVLFHAADVFIIGIIPAYAIDGKGLFPSIGHWLALAARGYFRIFGVSLLFRVILLIGPAMLNFGLTQLMTLIFFPGGEADPENSLAMLSITTALYLVLILIPNQAASHAFYSVLYCNEKVKQEGLGAELLARHFIDEPVGEGRSS